MSYVEEHLLRERLATAHRDAARIRAARALRARRRAEVAARRALVLAVRADRAAELTGDVTVPERALLLT
ncbi:hypothetical protein AB2L27_07980 [Kineococcus sp. LSe6-4]|uniref:5-formyltetrahydrofolate cyclo-ligase n=1 Tax=Kineococcus halophytocola TaxID=3234027 RepID=A0ABV4H1Y2_9ACTN